MPSKPKKPQKETPDEISGRDLFQTPNYAVDLLVPFLTRLSDSFLDTRLVNPFAIWECAEGLGKITNRLRWHGFDVFGSDLSTGVNFLTDPPPADFHCVVTNPPFSLKKKFYEMCKGYGVPFALLIPADYSQWTIEAVKNDGAEKIIPTRRIDYITPNILQRIHEGEVWETLRAKYLGGVVNNYPKNKLEEFKKEFPATWDKYTEEYKDFCKWDSIYDVPAMFLKKYSSSYYHSMWLCKGFNIGKSETFVELSKADKLNI